MSKEMFVIFKKDEKFYIAKMTEYGEKLADEDSSKVFADDEKIWTKWEDVSSDDVIDRLGLDATQEK